jgi:CheY-like chemotaxis protein
MPISGSVILLVEHDVAVRTRTPALLADHGFKVVEAAGGLEAVAVMLSYEGEIALAIVEIILPGVNGLDFANQLVIDRPKTEILYVSASPDSVAADSISHRSPKRSCRCRLRQTGSSIVYDGSLRPERRASVPGICHALQVVERIQHKLENGWVMHWCAR